MNLKLILVLLCTASVTMGCHINDTCVACTADCFWVKFWNSDYCLTESVYEIPGVISISPGDTKLCAEFQPIVVNPRPKPTNITWYKLSSLKSEAVSSKPFYMALLASIILLFAVWDVIYILKKYIQRRNWPRLYSCARYERNEDEDEVVVCLDN